MNTANDQANTSINQADVAKSLISKGISTKKVNSISEAIAARLNHQELTGTQRSVLRFALNSTAVRDTISEFINRRKTSTEQPSQNIPENMLPDQTLSNSEKLQQYQIPKREFNEFSEATDLAEQYEGLEKTEAVQKDGKVAGKTVQDVFKNPPTDLLELSAKIDGVLDKYCRRGSKWSGKTILRTRREMPGANGRKEWNCDISLRNTAELKTVVHEHLHARLISYYDPNTYIEHRAAEEGTVELFAQEICKKNGVEFKGAYSEYVRPLCIINNILRNGDRYSFAKQLFDIPLPERYNWLRDEADRLIATGKLSKKTVECLNDTVEFFRKKDVK